MSLKFEGEMLEAIRDLKQRLLLVEKAVQELNANSKHPPIIDEVSHWLSKRHHSKDGRI